HSRLLLLRPTGVPASLSQIRLHIVQLLLELREFFLLLCNLSCLGVDFCAVVLFFHGLCWIGLILQRGFFQFTLKNFWLLFRPGSLGVLVGESFSPSLLAVRVLFLLSVFLARCFLRFPGA